MTWLDTLKSCLFIRRSSNDRKVFPASTSNTICSAQYHNQVRTSRHESTGVATLEDQMLLGIVHYTVSMAADALSDAQLRNDLEQGRLKLNCTDVDLSKLCQNIVTGLATSAAFHHKTIVYTRTTVTSAVSVQADAAKVKQSIRNLIKQIMQSTNAIIYIHLAVMNNIAHIIITTEYDKDMLITSTTDNNSMYKKIPIESESLSPYREILRLHRGEIHQIGLRDSSSYNNSLPTAFIIDLPLFSPTIL